MARSGFVDRHQARIFWEERGAASAAAVVVLHGAFGASPAMENQIAALATSRRVIAIDARGHGRSSHDGDALHYADLADDVVAVLDALHIARADVVGWSDGGIVGLDLARRHAARVGKVVAIGANRSPEGLGAALAGFGAITADEPGLAFSRGLYEERAPHPARWPRLVEQLKVMLLNEPRWSDADLAVIRTPVLLIYGEHDDVTAEHAAGMQRAIAGARLLTIAGGTHMVPVQKADEVNAAIAAFFDG